MNTIKIVIAGHVDHGKSTLIGKILNDSSQVLTDRYQKVENICRNKSMKFEYAFLLDAFEEEQKQGITIDKLEIPWVYQEKKYIFIDTPGHKEFINNMVSGSSTANLAIVLIDANEGIRAQTYQHLNILNLFGVKKVIIVINKMDLINYDQYKFELLKNEFLSLITNLQFEQVEIIPIAAYLGDNIFKSSNQLSWYTKSPLIEVIQEFSQKNCDLLESKLNRLSIQDVYKFDDKRIYAGIILNGVLNKQSNLNFIKTNAQSTINTFEAWNSKNADRDYGKNDVVSFTLKDSLYLAKGDIAYWNSNQPRLSKSLILSTFWFSKNEPVVGRTYTLKIANQKQLVTLEHLKEQTSQIYHLTFICSNEIIYDFFEECPTSARAIILDQFSIVGAGVISKLHNVQIINHPKLNNESFIIWLTGLSGAGKSTVALELKKLIDLDQHKIIILDGDELRQGLNSDLGFSDEDRLEQARRVACLAEILTKQGYSIIVSLISPQIKGRSMAREILKEQQFIEVFVDVPIEECAKRDSKGLYKLAHKGEISQFTGIGSPYEPPVKPEIRIDNLTHSALENAVKIKDFLAIKKLIC